MDEETNGSRARTTASETAKERARQARRQAYQKAKARLAQDPRHLERKEAAKQRRREQYRKIKERRKEAAAARKAALRAEAAAHFQQPSPKDPSRARKLDELMRKLRSHTEAEAEIANDVS